MKLIMTQEVSGLGGPGDVVDVKPGYGRNYLLPQGYAIAWTRGGEKQVADIRRAREAKEIRDHDQADEVKASLEGRAYNLSARAGSGGRLFGSITAAEIVNAVKRAGGPELDRRRVEMVNPIKSTGRHKVTVRLHPEVLATFDVHVAGTK